MRRLSEKELRRKTRQFKQWHKNTMPNLYDWQPPRFLDVPLLQMEAHP